MSDQESNSPITSGVIFLTLVLFLVMHVGLSYLGFIPSEVSEFNQKAKHRLQGFETITYQSTSTRALPKAPVSETASQAPRPTKITIDKINVESEIQHPTQVAVSALDAALKKGVVHYPGSGRPGDDRRMFLFGHSSRLPVVQNQAYKSFNGLEELDVGDEISVESGGDTYVYQVSSVRVVDKDEALVSFADSEDGLTLSTCTTFGSKENRVVVEASRK